MIRIEKFISIVIFLASDGEPRNADNAHPRKGTKMGQIRRDKKGETWTCLRLSSDQRGPHQDGLQQRSVEF